MPTNSDCCQRWSWISGPSDTNSPNTANDPGARNGAVGCQINSSLYLFGGTNSDSAFFNDLWVYNISQNTWTWLAGSNNTNDFSNVGQPASRMAGTLWTYNDVLYLFGGFNPNGYYSDLWTYYSYWSQVPQHPNSPIPVPRGGATNWQIGSDLYLFGGVSSISDGGRVNDLWRYNVNTRTWTLLSGSTLVNQFGSYGIQYVAASDNQPGARSGALGWVVSAGKEVVLVSNPVAGTHEYV